MYLVVVAYCVCACVSLHETAQRISREKCAAERAVRTSMLFRTVLKMFG